MKERREDGLYPITMTGPNSFTLEGQEYTGRPSVAGRKLAEGERAFAGSVLGGKRGLVIMGAADAPRRRRLMPNWGIAVNVTDWLQSNQGPGQNALGGIITAALYTMDPATVTSWPLPTSDDPETFNEGLKPFGMVKYDIDPSNPVYATMWPQKQVSDGAIQVFAGGWDANAKTVLWQWSEGSYYVPEASYENQVPPCFNLFFVSTGSWLFAAPTTAFLGGYYTQTIFTSRSSMGFVSKSNWTGSPPHNISFHGWTSGEGEAAVDNIYAFLPYVDEGPVPDATVQFLKFDNSSAWASHCTRTVADLPVGGATAVPNLLGTGNANALGSPSAWTNNEALIFVSGGTQDLFDADKWTKVHWTLRSLNPDDGTDGAFVKHWDATASDTPTLLDPGSMKAAVAARSYPLYYVDEGTWWGGISYSADTDASLEYFRQAAPVILPVSLPNTGRLSTIESRMACDSLGNQQWPEVLENTGGGVVKDEGGTIWIVTLEPKQVLYGGEYSQIENGTHETYRLNTSVQVEGSSAVTGESYVSTPSVEITLGTATFTVSVGSPVGPITSGDPPITYSAALTQVADWPVLEWRWNQFVGCTWRTMLRGYRSSGTVVEQDISQTLDATTTANLGRPVDEDITVTQLDLEVGNNVHQLISFSDKNLVAILRDLHLDGAGNNPTPALEVWRIASTTATKLSTTRLGSYDELLSVDATLGIYETKAGDQVWDPYKFGPPRMKACRKAGTDRTPAIVILVSENKKVDPATQSQFKRVCYATVELDNPEEPTVTRSARTSEDLGVGSSGYPTGADYYGPIWDSWDTLVLTPDHVAWIKDSQFRETTA